MFGKNEEIESLSRRLDELENEVRGVNEITSFRHGKRHYQFRSGLSQDICRIGDNVTELSVKLDKLTGILNEIVDDYYKEKK